MEKRLIKDILISILIVIVLFIISTLLVDKYINYLDLFVKKNYFLGITIFIFAQIIAIVFAPLTSVPLTPIASRTYGFILTILFLYIGTIIGSIIAFLVAKKYGKKLVSKIVNLETTESLFANLTPARFFISLILLRVALPSDLLSYSEGIFLEIPYKTYITTTLIGSVPASIFFALLGTLSIIDQLVLWFIALMFVVAILKTIFTINKIGIKNNKTNTY